MSVTVRGAEVSDASAIAAVQGRSWEAAYRGLLPDSWFDQWTDERRSAQWRTRLDSSGVVVWLAVATDDGGATGFCGLALPTRDDDGDEDTAEITSFYVDPASWRGGVGRQLMERSLADLAQRGWTEVTLWVFEANPRARAFYASRGFEPDGGRRDGDAERPPEIRMRRAV